MVKSFGFGIGFTIRQRQFRAFENIGVPRTIMPCQHRAFRDKRCKAFRKLAFLAIKIKFRPAGQQQFRLPGGPIRSARQHHALALKPPEDGQLG
ncbi:hypothetical protein D3C80_1096470 [compost metagenome]